MSPAENLARRRAMMIALADKLSTVGYLTHEDDQEMARAVAIEVPEGNILGLPRQRLRFSTHARRRMAQRNVSPRDVYAIWTFGERRKSGDAHAFVMTRRAIADAGIVRLDHLAGHVIIVASKENEDDVLVTVIVDGEDTKFADFGK